jgi:hypothetical protein
MYTYIGAALTGCEEAQQRKQRNGALAGEDDGCDDPHRQVLQERDGEAADSVLELEARVGDLQLERLAPLFGSGRVMGARFTATTDGDGVQVYIYTWTYKYIHTYIHI